MILNKRYIRNIKTNLSFYICVIILTALTIIMYVGFSGAFNGEKEYLSSFYDKNNVEDAEFNTYLKIDDDTMDELSKAYNLELEEQFYSDFDFTKAGTDKHFDEDISADYTIRVFNPGNKINRYQVIDGRDLRSSDEILLNPHFLSARGIKIGDTVSLNGTDYTIVGTMAKPDYLSTYKNLTDNMFSYDSFGYGIVSEDAFSRFDDDDKRSYYTVLYHDESKQPDFRRSVHSDYYTLSYTPASSNVRIRVPMNETEELKMYANVIIPMMVLFIVIIIAIILGRKIRSEAKQIGVLSALGYSKLRLAVHYSIFGIIPGIIGAILGAILAIPCRDYLARLVFDMKIEKLPVEYSSTLPQLIFAALIPVISYGLAGLLTAFRVLRFNTIELLHGKGGTKKHLRMRMAKLPLKFSTKFKLRAIIGNISRTIVVLFGIALGGILMIFCYVCIDSLENYCEKSVNEVGSYEYEYFLNTIASGEVINGCQIMVGSFGVEGFDTPLLLMGMDENPYMDLKTTSGEKVTLSPDKYYISAMGAMIYGIEKGDTLSFYDQASLEECRVTITDIIQNDSQSILYSKWSDACSLLNVPEGSYNAVMSDRKLDYKESDYLYVITKSELSKQIHEVVVSMNAALTPCVLFAILIIVICVYLMVNMLIGENASTISMLKVLGYEDAEINRLMINIYHILVPIGLVLGAALGIIACKANFEASVSAYNTYIETVYGPLGFVKYAVWVLVSYAGSLILLSRKVKNTNLVESLKDNRE